MYVLSTGAPQTGLVFNSVGLTAAYSFTGATAGSVSITLATLATVTTAWSSGGFIEIDATKMPGLYRFDIPNAALAAAKGRDVVITFTGFTGMRVDHTKIELTGWDNQDAVRGGMTALPNANAAAANGLHVLGTNATAVSYTAGVTISNTAGDALTLTSTNATSNGLVCTGNTSGSGIKSTGGATGNGMTLSAGATSGIGLSATGVGTSGHGFKVTGGGTTAHGILVTGGSTTSDGIQINASSGRGMNVSSSWNNAGGNAVLLSTSGNGPSVLQLDSSGGNNAHGINIIATGTGSGINSTAGATGHGALFTGGATSGDGIRATAATSGIGLNAIGVGTTMPGIKGTGGTTTSAGMSLVGGATSGDGLLISAPTLGHGISATATGTSKHGATLVAGGTTAVGLNIVGGSTSGDGIKVVTTSGHGINLAPVGTSMHGILATGGNGGTSDGLKCVAGTGGTDIRATNITGTLSTLTTYTGDTPQTGDCYARLGAPAGASIAADLAEIEAETDGIAAISTATPLTAAQIATGVWQDTTAGDFTVSASIGKSVMNGVALGTGLTINAYTGNTVQTGDSFARIGVAGAGLTNIGTIATCTNLTNAPTSGDLTAAMKTSVQTAADAAVTANALVLEIEAETDGIAAIPTAAVPTANENADALLDRANGIESGYTLRQIMRLITSVLLGKVTETATVDTFRDINDTKNRVTATDDSSGNRTAITYDGT